MKNRFLFSSLILLLAGLIFPVACYGSQGSSCHKDDPATIEKRCELGPWLNEFENQIRQRARLQGFEAIWLRSNRQYYQIIGYHCYLSKNGMVDNLKLIGAGSGSAELDLLAKEIILDSSPFSEPTNSLPCQDYNGIIVNFQRLKGEIEIRAFIPRRSSASKL